MVYAANTILIIIYHSVLNLIPNLSRRKKDRIFLALSSIQIVLIVGTRNFKVGRDTINFFRMFQRISNYKTLTDYEFNLIEPLYAILNFIVGKITGSYLIFNILIASFTMLFLSMAIYKLSNNVFWSVYIFISCCFFYQMMNQFRQLLAMSITLYAFSFLVEKKTRKYILWILVATLIHKSAFIMVILVPLLKIRYSKKMMIQYAFITVAGLLFSDIIVKVIRLTPYRVYLGSSFDKHFELSAILNLIVRTCMFAFVCFFYQKYKTKEHQFNIDLIYHLITWNLVFQVITVQFMLFGRLTSYFFYGYFLLIPNVLENCFEKIFNRRFIKTTLFIMLLIYQLVYYTYTKSSYGVASYSNYFF